MPFTTTVITGATSDIGRYATIELAKKDHAIYLLTRNKGQGEDLAREIEAATKNKNIHVVPCDLANLQSVRDAADILRSSLLGINVLINGATETFADYQESIDGHEMTFAVNNLGHFYLVQCLMPMLERGQARIINVSSEAHRDAAPRLHDINWRKKPYSAYKAFANSKLYNILFTRSLAVKYGSKGISSFALSPGMVNTAGGEYLTKLARTFTWLLKPFMTTAEDGAKTITHLATAPRIDAKSGKYFKGKETYSPSSNAIDEPLRKKFWEVCEEMTSGIDDNI
ncbi:SDR family NAD(P)-dependent oxidoreductase [Mucilaginibacter pallidiroseus]|uniref:SDR family NAD(P)-dependent oxidoreductase n=1 Tax=Mucilaginibacter pallidiroseus TaxID=2599295 RepID=A0A563UJV6_9SPHI|nr:SDR family NAD(P)-dependent oxidoreductase [Mucilaginibacter pallidiroseus]TWR31631.1 SDR family NAD(P)-dependent oxidoreductase [Mucilaginibacter pallidiroseus]